jgi:hypothetical protein
MEHNCKRWSKLVGDVELDLPELSLETAMELSSRLLHTPNNPDANVHPTIPARVVTLVPILNLVE